MEYVVPPRVSDMVIKIHEPSGVREENLVLHVVKRRGPSPFPLRQEFTLKLGHCWHGLPCNRDIATGDERPSCVACQMRGEAKLRVLEQARWADDGGTSCT